eukprot:SAG11_NODE_659_length_7895_cov_18.189969_12_plen_43_part_00
MTDCLLLLATVQKYFTQATISVPLLHSCASAEKLQAFKGARR